MLEITEGNNQKWTIQRNWQHRVHTTKKNKTKTTQYVLDTIIRKQTTNNVNKTKIINNSVNTGSRLPRNSDSKKTERGRN
jgi:hypothetical protein